MCSTLTNYARNIKRGKGWREERKGEKESRGRAEGKNEKKEIKKKELLITPKS